MASPLPNQPSGSGGVTGAVPLSEPNLEFVIKSQPGHILPTEDVHPVVSLSVGIPSDYIDFLIDTACATERDRAHHPEDLEAGRVLPSSPDFPQHYYDNAQESPPHHHPSTLEPPSHHRHQPEHGKEPERCCVDDGKPKAKGRRVIETDVKEASTSTKKLTGSSSSRRLLRRQKLRDARVQGDQIPSLPRSEKPGGLALPKHTRRQRREKPDKRAYREKHGWCARPYIRERISTMVLTEHIQFDMLDMLVEGTQLGGYRPRVQKMEEGMGQMAGKMKLAYSGASESPGEDVLEDLKATGYRVVPWDGFNPILLLDTEERVFGTLVGQPTDPTWGAQCMQLYDLMAEDKQKIERLPRRNHSHRRGSYSTIGAGVTFSPGNTEAHNLHLEAGEKEIIYRVSDQRWKIKMDIRKFAETSFDIFAPRLYCYYVDKMKQLQRHPKYGYLEYGNPYLPIKKPEPSGFACHVENFPPSAFTKPHRDTMNLAFGWCAIIALGRFDPQRGSHLVLHDLKLVIPFPHGSFILIPSSFLWHSNVPIHRDDQRASLTFFSPGGLFRFIDNDFKLEEVHKSSMNGVDRRLHRVEKDHRVKIGVSFYSKLHEVLNPKDAELDPILF